MSLAPRVPKLWILVFLAVAWISSPSQVLAQDPSPAGESAETPARSAQQSALVERTKVLAETRRRLDALGADLARAKGEERADLSAHLEETREELRTQIGAAMQALRELGAADERAPKAQVRAITSALKHDAGLLAQDYVDAEEELAATREEADKSEDATQKNELGGKLVRANEGLVTLLEQMLENLTLRAELGLEVGRDAGRIDDRLARRGRRIGTLLRATAEELDAAQSFPSADAEQRAARQEQRAMLQERVNGLGTLLGRVIAMMKERKLEVIELQQLRIESTGRVSTDVLDIDVGVGLLRAWFERTKTWAAQAIPEAGFTLIVFLLIVGAARVLAWVARRIVRRMVRRARMSELAREFLINSSGRIVLLAGILLALGQAGVQMGPMLAGLGIAGFIVAFALQDSLGNFACGMMILAYRPFDVGDLVEAAGISGVVAEMTLVSTSVLTLDNQRLIVPNSKIWNDVIHNMTTETRRRVDFVFGVGYSEDIDHVAKVLREVLAAEDRILKDPESIVEVHELGDSSVNFAVRVWVDTEVYWQVFWAINAAVKRRFDAEGISIPFPQRDVHIHNS